MNTLFNSEEKFNELVFENRNKDYGAYAIRSTYNDTVAKSLGLTLSGISLLFLAVYIFSTSENKIIPDTGTNTPPLIIEQTVEVNLKKPESKPKVEKPKDVIPPKTTTANFSASDDPDKTINKTNSEMNVAKVNNEKGVDSVGEHAIKEPAATMPLENKDPERFVDQMPEFVGNMYQFIKDHLQYPQMAVENGTQGVVGLSFVVEKDGSIGDITVLGKVADGCTEEAIRVVKMMPKWKPGKNHGELVRVIFNLPIKFRLQ